MRIKVKDFEVIDTLDLQLNNEITCIVGASDNGKSALMRAINYILYNKHSDSSVQIGKSNYMIGIEDNENIVMVKRNKDGAMKTQYVVNGKPIQKVGRNAIPEVSEALGIEEIEILGSKFMINFIKQMQYPFMLGWTGGQIYSFLSQSANQDSLGDVLSDLKTDLKEITDTKKRLEGQVDILKDMHDKAKKTYETVKDVETTTDKVLALQGKVNDVYNLDSIINTYSHSIEKSLELEKQKSFIVEELDILKPLDTLDDKLSFINNLTKDMKDLAYIYKQLKETSVTKSVLTKRISDLDFTNIEFKIERYGIEEQAKIKLERDIEKHINNIEALDLCRNKKKSISEALDIGIKVNTLIDTHLSLESNIKDLTKMISNIDEINSKLKLSEDEKNRLLHEKEDIEKELSTFTVCDYCGSPLSN